MRHEPDMYAKLTPRLRQHLAHLEPEALVTVSARLRPMPLEEYTTALAPQEDRTEHERQHEDALAHVLGWLDHVQSRVPTVRVWRRTRVTQLGIEAPRQMIEQLARLDSIKEISLPEEEDDVRWP